MILKYIEARVIIEFMDYEYFDNNDLKIDENENRITLPMKYVKNDFKQYMYYINDIFNNLIKYKIFNNMHEIEEAIINKKANTIFSITYCKDIQKYYDWRYSKNIKTLDDEEKYCSAIKYYFNLKTKRLSRYQVFGDMVLGDEIPRGISYYNKKEKEK